MARAIRRVENITFRWITLSVLIKLHRNGDYGKGH